MLACRSPDYPGRRQVKLEDWKTGRLENWKIGKFGNQKLRKKMNRIKILYWHSLP